MKIVTKRIYEEHSPAGVARILVDRLWPRGLKKEKARINAWLKEVAPSDALRRWFGHSSSRWKEFQRRYFAELDAKPEVWRPILERARAEAITLLYAARDTEHNNAVALQTYLERQVGRRRRRSKGGS